jgi:branched-chain amino acid transport system substrate-binding protein
MTATGRWFDTASRERQRPEDAKPSGRLHSRLAVLSAACLALAGCQSGASPPPITLGHVSNLSAVDGAGQRAQQGIDLALKEAADANLAEALDGRRLQVRHTDTRGQADAYESQAVRLVSVNRVAGLIGGLTPEQVVALDRSHITVVSPCGVRPAGVSDLVFAIGMRPAQQAFVLAKYAAEDLKIADVTIVIDERREAFASVADAFARQFAQTCQAMGKTATTTPVRYGKDAKWEDLAARIVERKSAGAVVFAGAARDWPELRRKQAITVPLLFAGEDGDVANLEPGAAKETIYHATAFAPDADAPHAQAFIRKYREGFKEDPDVAAALGYEALQLYAAALKEISPAFTTEKLLTALRGTKDFPGLAGPLTMTAEQHVRRPLYVMRRTGTAVAQQRRFDPATLP